LLKNHPKLFFPIEEEQRSILLPSQWSNKEKIMTYKELKLKLKTELKIMAIEIHFDRSRRKSVPNGYISGLLGLQENVRIKHLAYCMLKGTPYEKIEPNHSKHQDVRDYKDLSDEDMKRWGFKTKSVMEVYEAEYIKEQADELLAKYREQLDKENVA